MHKSKKMKRQYQHTKIYSEEAVDMINKIKYSDRTRQYDKCLKLLDEYLDKYPNDNYMRIYQARINGKIHKDDKEIEMLEEILSLCNLSNKERLFAIFSYALVLDKKGNFDKSIEYFLKGINSSDNLELIARKNLASVFCEVKRYDDALKILTIDGYNDQLLNNERAKVYSFMGRFSQGLHEIDKPYENKFNALIKEKLDTRIIEQQKNYIKGHILYRLGRYDEALELLEKTTTFKNRDEYFLATFDIIRIKLSRGFCVEAISLCDAGISSSFAKDTYVSLYKKLKIEAYVKLNNMTKAEEVYSEKPESKYDRVYSTAFLLSNGKLEEAEKVLDKIYEEEYESIDDDFEVLFKLAITKYRLKKYEESLVLAKKLLNELDGAKRVSLIEELRRLELLNNVMLNNPIEERVYSYSEKQIISYSKESAIEHIKDHHIYSKSYNNFSDEIDVDKLYDEVVEMLDDCVPRYNRLFDLYFIRYEKIGYVDQSFINQLNVIVIPGTKNIITMFPAISENNYDIDDSTVEKKKTKRLSQIDKFNKRYGIK